MPALARELESTGAVQLGRGVRFPRVMVVNLASRRQNIFGFQHLWLLSVISPRCCSAADKLLQLRRSNALYVSGYLAYY